MASGDTWNENAADDLIDHRLALLRYEAGATQALLKAYDDALREVDREFKRLYARVHAGDSLNRAQLERLASLGTNLAKRIRALREVLADVLDERLTETADSEAAFQEALFARNLGTSVYATVPEAAVLAAVRSPIGGGVWTDRLAADLVEAHDRLQAVLATTMARGASMDRIARALRDGTGVVETYRGRLVAIARTEVQRVANTVAHESYRANLDVLSGVQRLATLDSRTCLVCAPLHNKVWRYDAKGRLPKDHVAPPLHPRCFIGDTVVSGPGARAATRRWYDGDVVEVRTSSGAVFTVTPNHPMLTTKGWVAAGLLREGGDVIRCPDPERMMEAVDPHDHQKPAPIEDVPDTLRQAFGVTTTRVPAAPEDFHGDGEGGEVEIVGPHRDLWRHGDTALLQHPVHRLLGGRPTAGDPLPPEREALLKLRGERLAAHGCVGRLGVLAALLRGSGGGHSAVDFEGAPHLCSGPREPVAHEAAARAEAASAFGFRDTGDVGGDGVGVDGDSAGGACLGSTDGERRGPIAPEPTEMQGVVETVVAGVEPRSRRLATLASHVRVDRIVKVLRGRFGGHVYNLETTTGWYIANGIVTHNCRCFDSPVSKSWRDLGFKVTPEDRPMWTDRPALDTTFDAWLKRRDVATQEEFFGSTAKRAAWLAGVPLTKFSDAGRVLGVGELRRRYPGRVPAG